MQGDVDNSNILKQAAIAPMKKTNWPIISRVFGYQKHQKTNWRGSRSFLNNVCASYKVISSEPKKLTEPNFSKTKAIVPAKKIFGLFLVTIRPLQTSRNMFKVSTYYISIYGALYKIVLRNT